jgi:16S rRNA (guanine966-N2)-methyltransferase
MRIIAGRYKGRQLAAPDGDGTRPTMDRVREALFSILGDVVDGSRVLDLFAGAGTLGMEALSRGALEATFVEFRRSVVQVLEANLEKLTDARYRVLAGPVDRMLLKLGRGSEQFDLVFLDPPYRMGLVPVTLDLLVRNRLLSPKVRVVAEFEARFAPPREVGSLFLADRRTYGDSGFAIYSILEGGANG